MFFKRSRMLSVIILILALVLTACSKKEGKEAVFDIDAHEGDLAVYFFHLEGEEKTGESIFVQTPDGQNILIDAGIPEVGEQVDDYLEELNVEKLDYVLPSHPHIDHIGGLHTIFKTKDIGKVIEIDVPHDTGTYDEYKRIMEDEDIDVEIGEAGDVIELEDDLKLEFINPPKGTNKDSLIEGYSDKKASHLNNVSEVIKLTHGDNDFLFTGDIYLKTELQLIKDYGEFLESDVLVAPHHGHDTSSSPQFIEAVDPDIAVIPSNVMFSQTVYKRYAKERDVYHSSINGHVVILSDGKTLDVITEKETDEEE